MSEWVKIVHPETGGTAEVHRSSLYQHYQGGWQLLTEDEVPQPDPEPVTRKQAAKAAQATENELKEL